jgi:DNA repair exonuclease SbcCD nuclease subunit
MKFIHIADLHLDSPFTMLSEKGNLGEIRRLEQRNTFKKVINYCKENNIEYIFIAGDLYEHDYVKKTSIDFINNLFKEIPETKVFITPGNHDPYIKNSIYETYEFSKNVYVFKDSKIEKIEDEKINLYGAAFTEFYREDSPLEELVLENNGKPNILLLHCDLNGSKDKEGFSYCPILTSKIKSLKFDYSALGHVHKTNYEPNNNIVYSGSLTSFGFDELGDHGMIVGEIKNGNLETEFVPLDERKFEEIHLDVQKFNSKEEIIEEINVMYLEPKTMYKIILEGKRNFEIEDREILNLLTQENVLKVKDKTKINYDLEKISKENSLKGIFVKEVLEKVKKNEITEEEAEKAIELVLDVM